MDKKADMYEFGMFSTKEELSYVEKQLKEQLELALEILNLQGSLKPIWMIYGQETTHRLNVGWRNNQDKDLLFEKIIPTILYRLKAKSFIMCCESWIRMYEDKAQADKYKRGDLHTDPEAESIIMGVYASKDKKQGALVKVNSVSLENSTKFIAEDKIIWIEANNLDGAITKIIEKMDKIPSEYTSIQIEKIYRLALSNGSLQQEK